MIKVIILCLASLFLRIVHAEHNITVEDYDPSIVYSGIWSYTQPDSNGWDTAGTHHFSNTTIDPNAYATFIFTGELIHFSFVIRGFSK